MTSVIFLTAIFLTILFLSVSKKDTIIKKEDTKGESGGMMQTVIVLCLFICISSVGYSWRHSMIQSESQNTSGETSQGSISSGSTLSGSHEVMQKI